MHNTMSGLATYQGLVTNVGMVANPEKKRLSDAEAFGLALKRLRKRADMTQEAAAAKVGQAGVETNTWRRYEWGHRDLSLAKWVELAEIVGANEELLLAEKRAVLEGHGPVSPPLLKIGVMYPPLGSEGLIIRDRVRAGAWLHADDVDQDEPRRYPAALDPRFPKAEQWLSEVNGDSVNELGIIEGDLVHCVSVADIGYYPKTGDLVEVERWRFEGRERELTLKQVEVTPTATLLRGRSTNPRWNEPLSLNENLSDDEDFEVRVRGLVIHMIRRL